MSRVTAPDGTDRAFEVVLESKGLFLGDGDMGSRGHEINQEVFTPGIS